jgi:tetratricopeptide (TPR) repeat protein
MPLLRLIHAIFLWTLITSLSFGLLAKAEDEKLTEPEKDQAAASFLAGQELFRQGAYLEAAAAFEKANSLRPHPHALANIGYCYDEASDYPRAVEAFRKYLENPTQENPQFNARIKNRLKELEPKVGDLEVKCHSLRCEVIADGISRGVSPKSFVLLAGSHEVQVVALDEGVTLNYAVTIAGGEKTVLDVALPRPQPSKPTDATHGPSVETAPKSDKEPIRLRAPFWVATAATVVGVGAVAVLGGLNYSNMEDFKKAGSDDVQLKERGDSLTLGSKIAVGLTAATAVTAIICAIIDLKRSRGKSGGRHGAVVFGATPENGAFVGVRMKIP